MENTHKNASQGTAAHLALTSTSQSLSGQAARIAGIVALTQKILRALEQGDNASVQQRAKPLVGLIEVFMKKDAQKVLPKEVKVAQDLVARLRASGFVLLCKSERRQQRKEQRRQTKLTEVIRTMIRRTKKSKPKPKGKLNLIYTAFESSRTRH